MQAFLLTSYLTSICSLLLGIYVFSRNPKNIINKTFALLCTSAVIWSFGLSLEVSATSEIWGLFWSKTLHVGVVFLHTSFFHFVTALLNINKQKKNAIRIFYFSSVLFLFLIFHKSLFIKGVGPILSFNYYTQPGMLYPLFLVFFFSGIIYGCFLMAKSYKNLSAHKRNQILYFSCASIIGFSGGSTTYLPVFGIDVFPIANYFVFLYTLITAFAITKTRLMDISVVVSRSTSWILTVVFLGSIYTGLIRLYQVFISPRIDLLFIVWTILYGIIVGETFQKIRLFLQTTTNKTFIQGWYESDKVLQSIAVKLTPVLSIKDATKIIGEELKTHLEIDDITIILPLKLFK